MPIIDLNANIKLKVKRMKQLKLITWEEVTYAVADSESWIWE